MDVTKDTGDQMIPHIKCQPNKKVSGHGILGNCHGMSQEKLAKGNEDLIGTYF